MLFISCIALLTLFGEKDPSFGGGTVSVGARNKS